MQRQRSSYTLLWVLLQGTHHHGTRRTQVIGGRVEFVLGFQRQLGLFGPNLQRVRPTWGGFGLTWFVVGRIRGWLEVVWGGLGEHWTELHQL